MSQKVADCVQAYPCSGEINYKVEDAKKVLEHIKQHYIERCDRFDTTDGLSFEFTEFRFNVRTSNTEPLLRLNVETRGNNELLQQELQTLNSLIKF